MKKSAVFTILASTFIFSSCSSHKLVKVDGLKRVEISQDSYSKPQYYIKEFKPTKRKTATRSIASVKEDSSSEEVFNLPNKKLYFFTLWQQYGEFNSLLGKNNNINSCPQFHNDLLEYESNLSKHEAYYSLNQDYTALKVNPKLIVNYPVMSLPYKNTDLYSYINQTGSWDKASELVQEAITKHNKNNELELTKLCQNGNSGGYYIYENMVSYYTNNEDFQYSNQALPSILKVNTISNMYLLDSLVKPKFKRGHITTFQSALLNKLNVSWFKNYLYETNLMRNNNKKRFVLKD